MYTYITPHPPGVVPKQCSGVEELAAVALRLSGAVVALAVVAVVAAAGAVVAARLALLLPPPVCSMGTARARSFLLDLCRPRSLATRACRDGGGSASPLLVSVVVLVLCACCAAAARARALALATSGLPCTCPPAVCQVPPRVRTVCTDAMAGTKGWARQLKITAMKRCIRRCPRNPCCVTVAYALLLSCRRVATVAVAVVAALVWRGGPCFCWRLRACECARAHGPAANIAPGSGLVSRTAHGVRQLPPPPLLAAWHTMCWLSLVNPRFGDAPASAASAASAVLALNRAASGAMLWPLVDAVRRFS